MLGSLRKKTLQPGLTTIGLHDDGISMVSAARGDSNNVEVTAWDFRPWQQGTSLETVLTGLAKEHQLKRRRCATVLAVDDYRLLIAEKPDVPEQELAEALRWRIKDVLDFDVMTATLETFAFPAADGNSDPKQTYVVAAQNQALQRSIRLLESAGINLELIDIPEMSLRNIASLSDNQGGGVALLYLSTAAGLLTLTQSDVLFMSRAINVGVEGLLDPEAQQDNLEKIVLEVQRSADYFVSHLRQAPITQLLLAPLPTEIPNLDGYFHDHLGMSVRFLNLNELMQWQHPMPIQLQAKCFTTIGAALRYLN